MEALLKQISVLRIVNYLNFLVALTMTIYLSLEGSDLTLMSACLTVGLLIAALIINGLIIEIKREL